MNLKGLALTQIQEAARKIIKPQYISWIVVVDRSELEPKLQALGFRDVVIIDSDGEVVNEEQQLKTELDPKN